MGSLNKFTGKLVVVTGPTASGKTGISIKLAKYFGAPIISADSRQFYKEIPIGTAAPARGELKAAKHYMIGQLSISDEYNVSKFEVDVLNLLNNELVDCPVVIMTGGSGLYIDAVCKGIDQLPDIDHDIRSSIKQVFEDNGVDELRNMLLDLDPEYYEQVDLNNPVRLMRAIEVCQQTGKRYSDLRKNNPAIRSFDIIKIAINIPRDILVERINKRTDSMISQGWLKEVESVFEHRMLNSLNTVGYKELFAYLENKVTLPEAVEKIKTNTRRYAKRQMTWFRRDDSLNWFSPDDIEGIIQLIENGG